VHALGKTICKLLSSIDFNFGLLPPPILFALIPQTLFVTWLGSSQQAKGAGILEYQKRSGVYLGFKCYLHSFHLANNMRSNQSRSKRIGVLGIGNPTGGAESRNSVDPFAIVWARMKGLKMWHSGNADGGRAAARA